MQSFTQSATDADFVQNPYAFYDETRAQGPIFFWNDYKLPCVTSFAAVDALLRDRRLGREQIPENRKPVPEHIAPFMANEQHSMLELEPPRHTRLRGLVVRAFTSRRIKAMEADIASLTHQLIDEFPAGEFDLLPTFAEQIPVITIARLLGVPEDMADQLLAWSHDMVAMYQANRGRGIEDAAVIATLEFSDFMRAYIEKRRATPRDDLLSELIAAEEQGERLSGDELVTTAILLLNAGHEATVHGIGNGVKTLLESGQDIAPLLGAAMAGQTIEETLRFDPPLHMFTRYVYEDVHLFGHDLKRGDEIGLLLAAANRDPEQFDNPNGFEPSRRAKKNTSFGAGLHFCVGAPLARLELTTALPILFQRCPDLALSNAPVYADRYHFHGLSQLIVTT
jgi:cytochrome P450